MLHFGFATLLDVLSWIMVLALAAKVAATLIVLIVDRDARDRPGWGTTLWWVTKLTPLVAVPCAIAIALLEHDRDLVLLFAGLALFVAVAVPLAIRQRARRIDATRRPQAGADCHAP